MHAERRIRLQEREKIIQRIAVARRRTPSRRCGVDDVIMVRLEIKGPIAATPDAPASRTYIDPQRIARIYGDCLDGAADRLIWNPHHLAPLNRSWSLSHPVGKSIHVYRCLRTDKVFDVFHLHAARRIDQKRRSVTITNDSHRSEEHTPELQSLTNLVCRL